MQLIRAQLHDIDPTDPMALMLAIAVLVASGLVAALLPSLRAARV